MKKQDTPQLEITTELATVEPAQVVQREPNVGDMLMKLIDAGITADNVGALEKLVSLKRETDLWDAEKKFTEAMTALQAELPAIQAVQAVPNADGTVRYRYAPIDEIKKQLQPYLSKHGFSVAFDTEVDDKRVCGICLVTHVAGHTKAFRYAVRIGSGPPKATESQADGSAYSYAKRGALGNAFNIVIEKDTDDARLEGGTITPEQAANLKKRVDDTGTDPQKFLNFAGAKTFEEISASKLMILDQNLKKKEGVYQASAFDQNLRKKEGQ